MDYYILSMEFMEFRFDGFARFVFSEGKLIFRKLFT